LGTDSRLDQVGRYHQETKHAPHGFAPGPPYMDWANQPDPFRRYRDAPLVELDRVAPPESASIDSPSLVTQAPEPRPLDHRFISQLFFDSLALSAWKAVGDTLWALRVNPSSGNLHPTEGYLISAAIPGLTQRPGVWHYAPREHALEQRLTLSDVQWNELRTGLPDPCVLLGLTSIHWREAWKYGARAYRYCQHDCGHAIACLAYAAGIMGWSLCMLPSVTDGDVEDLLGLSSQRGNPDAEHPDVMLAVFPSNRGIGRAGDYRPAASLLDEFRNESWHGEPNRLSRRFRVWPHIERVTRASRKDDGLDHTLQHMGASPVPLPEGMARHLIRQRRSAVQMDGETGLTRQQFELMLARTLPVQIPFLSLPWRARIHLVLFVHRVQGLAPGLYALCRHPDSRDRMKRAFRPELAWEPAAASDSELPLYELVRADLRDLARVVSCVQDIAADGAFACAMLAEFDASLEELGPWMYRGLHWEAGLIGQVLYLQSEAMGGMVALPEQRDDAVGVAASPGIRATGIGCFFDDQVHQLLGIEDGDSRFQTLYHFTVGGPVEDTRLKTLRPYPDRNDPA